jgi:hypothetical protein
MNDVTCNGKTICMCKTVPSDVAAPFDVILKNMWVAPGGSNTTIDELIFSLNGFIYRWHT